MLVAGIVLNAYLMRASRPSVIGTAEVQPTMVPVNGQMVLCVRFTDQNGGTRGGIACDFARELELSVTATPTPSTRT
jgi:hypothetical protein